ncbi:hypothetical protein GM415_06805 [Pseudodesulfovibrio cashew]|uniref:Uncharacterized protein n=1 Tax=Pseudodesulfovibrio cashew TaxID=2678688 RepID=A0A6I6JH56_9BACT|nr:hypothetical protein [Pseudodesulfovibrio cashew]QGY39843.1 hypothetical protein GM415_06805 [Pseudodesulfovibrio cashew]
MPAMEPTSGFDPRIDQLTRKIQELRERRGGAQGGSVDAAMDSAMDMVERNTGRREAREAGSALQGISLEQFAQGTEAHSLDPGKVADLIADPFEE